MNEEIVFDLIENSINMAVDKLQAKQKFQPYALTLSSLNDVTVLEKQHHDDDELYEDIFLQLKEDIICKDIEVVAIVALVDIAEHYKSEHDVAIRVHIEQKSLKEEKIGGKFIYAPYQIYKIENEHKVELYQPFSVGFIAEIFK